MLAAVAELGYVKGRPAGTLAAERLCHLAVPAGRDRRLSRQGATHGPTRSDLGRSVAGRPGAGRNAGAKADACWVPIAPGLSPHGLRHSYKTLMIELGTPAALMDAQMGHQDGSVQALYSHITAEMTRRLLDGLTAALDERRSLSPGSPVAVLDRMLAEVGS